MTKSIDGLGLSGFRSFASRDLQIVAPLNRVNLLAGQNNSGKSNVLRFVQLVLGSIRSMELRSSPSVADPGDLDTPQGEEDPLTEVALAFRFDTEDLGTFLEDKGKHLSDTTRDALDAVLHADALRLTNDELLWLRFELTKNRNKSVVAVSHEQLAAASAAGTSSRERKALGEASSLLTSTAGGHEHEDLQRVISQLGLTARIPRVETIGAFRQVRQQDYDPNSEEQVATHDGVGLIDTLARLEHPSIGTRTADRTKFDSINEFMRSVLDDESVRVEVPYERDTIHVHTDFSVLPLESLGTGIHQVLILAAAATRLTDHMICMEEPEIHLHPVLQRKLLRYLATKTTNQYLIATHSASMLDSDIASIFHLTLAEGRTKVRLATLPSEHAAICADLGYRPSDLVQCNAIIWVEGPSDRIYVRHWIKLVDPSLLEAVHYSIMFYGGRLLNQLSADDPGVRDFISLRRFNRNITILIDSDKRSAQSRINFTKKRVVDEFEKGPGFAWVTKGYTIENYVPKCLLNASVEAVHRGKSISWDGSRYQNPLSKEVFSGESPVDKVKVAKACVEMWTDVSTGNDDLKAMVERLVDFIRIANE